MRRQPFFSSRPCSGIDAPTATIAPTIGPIAQKNGKNSLAFFVIAPIGTITPTIGPIAREKAKNLEEKKGNKPRWEAQHKRKKEQRAEGAGKDEEGLGLACTLIFQETQ